MVYFRQHVCPFRLEASVIAASRYRMRHDSDLPNRSVLRRILLS
jgi:hypothetical protein